MIFEGNTAVLEVLKEKKRMMEAGLPHDHLQPLLIIDGGLMKGAYGTGAVLALEELGFTNCFCGVAGISSGAVAGAYLLSGNCSIGASVIYDEACSAQFRPRFDLKNVINVRFFERVLAGDTGKGLKFDTIFAHPIPLYIGVSDFTTAKPVVLQPTTPTDLLTAIRASISMPGAVSEPAVLAGVRYVDGASTEPHILSHMYETIEATHVLIITNQDKGTKHISWAEHFINNTFFRYRTNPTLRRAANWRREARHRFVETILAQPTKPVLFVWGNNSIESKESNPEVVYGVVEASRLWWRAQLS